MDKRKNKILIGCLALLLVMTVGYALFSENITINGTATAKGEFDITTTCSKGWDSRFGTYEDHGFAHEGGYKNDSCIVNGNEVSVNADLEYPGAIRYFTVKMTNTGTIDAIIDLKNGITISGTTCMDGLNNSSNFNGQIESDECRDLNTPDGEIMTRYVFGYGYQIIGMEDASGNLLFFENISSITEGILKPGESAYIIVSTGVNDIIDNNEMFLTTNTTFNFNWYQVQAQ